MNPVIEFVRSRCTECGDCWEWQGAVQEGNGNTPVMKRDRRVRPVRRVVLEAVGVKVAGRLATYKCGNYMCVNPAHLEAVTRSVLQSRISQTMRYHRNPATLAKSAQSRRLRAKLCPELAQRIRETEGSQRAIAREFGVCQATVGAIKSGRTWRDYSNPFGGLLK
jgi:hypothetical protein